MMTEIIQFEYLELQTLIRNCLKEAIEEIRELPTPEEISDRCTFLEACEITNLSKSQLYKLCMDGAIPYMKYGRKNIFSRKALTEWMESRIVIPASVDAVMTSRLQQSAKKRQ